jgi:hypothetical protein
MGLNYNPTIVPDGLVMYLDPANSRSYSGSGNTVYNLVNGGIAGTIVTGITYDNFSAKNLNFNGSSGYMFSNDTSMDFSTSDFTIQTTLELNGLSNGFSSAYGTVICAGAALTNNSSILQFVGTATSHFAIGLWHQPTTTTIGRNYNFQTNKIYNIAVVKNTSQVEFFVDGASIGTTTSSNFFNFTANGFVIGRWYYPGYEQYLKGNIYELKAYNRALSNQEIAQNYDAVKGRFVTPENIVTNGLVLNIDPSKSNSYSGFGNTIFDLSGSGFTGTLTNGPTFSGLNGGTIVFDGVDDFIDVSSISSISGDFTVGIWFYTTATSDIYYRRLIDFDYITGFWLGRYASSDNWGGGIIEPNSPYGIYLPFTNGQWHYLVSIRNGSTHTLYGDGITSTTSNTVSTGNLSSATKLKIASQPTGSNQFFNGRIAQVQLYNRALTQQEVLQNYNATKSRFGL